MLNKPKELLICDCLGYCLTLCTDQPLPCSIIRVRERKKKSWWHYDSSAPWRYILDLHSQHLLALTKSWIYYCAWWICHLYFFFFYDYYVKIRDMPMSFCLSCGFARWRSGTYTRFPFPKISRTDLRCSLDMHEAQCSLCERKEKLSCNKVFQASDSHPFCWIGPQETSGLNDVRIRDQAKDHRCFVTVTANLSLQGFREVCLALYLTLTYNPGLCKTC